MQLEPCLKQGGHITVPLRSCLPRLYLTQLSVNLGLAVRPNTPAGLTFPLGRYCCCKPTTRMGTKKPRLRYRGFLYPTCAIFPPQRCNHRPGCAHAHTSRSGLRQRRAERMRFLDYFRSFLFIIIIFIYGCLRESPWRRFEKQNVFSGDFCFSKKQSSLGLAVTFHPAGVRGCRQNGGGCRGRARWREAAELLRESRSALPGNPGREGAQPGATSVRPSRGPRAASPLPPAGVLSAGRCCVRPAAPQPLGALRYPVGSRSRCASCYRTPAEGGGCELPHKGLCKKAALLAL